MERIAELRKLCQVSRKYADTWYGWHVCRALSIYLTRIFLIWGISANAVTFLFTIVGIAGAACFTRGSPAANLIGVCLLQFWFILDHVDGEVARYRKTCSLTGIYFDKVSHYIVHPVLFFCLGTGAFAASGKLSMIYAGAAGSFSMLMLSLIDDLRMLVSLEYRQPASRSEKKQAGAPGSVQKDHGSVKRAFMLLHGISTFPNVMNILTAVVITEYFFRLNLMPAFLWFYAIGPAVVWGSRLVFFIATKNIDASHDG